MRAIHSKHLALLLGGFLSLSLPWWSQAEAGEDEPKDRLPVTGKAEAELASLNRMMTEFLPKYRIPGGAFAVARNGRIAYERGFGHADRDAREPVKPDALFRVASISKPITAVAILQLVERGKLKLDAKVFDVLGLTDPKGPDISFDERWRKVTILHLLHHAGGWDRGTSFDPMFRSSKIADVLKTKPPAGPADIIRYMLRQPLQFDPGAYAYSNFGYCLLGRVIEKVSGLPYEDYVRREVLAPLGVRRMRVGHTLLKDRARDEVRYYKADNAMVPALLGPELGQPVAVPYGGFYLEAMDSHGGWIASAADLVRFAAAFNVPDRCPS